MTNHHTFSCCRRIISQDVRFPERVISTFHFTRPIVNCISSRFQVSHIRRSLLIQALESSGITLSHLRKDKQQRDADCKTGACRVTRGCNNSFFRGHQCRICMQEWRSTWPASQRGPNWRYTVPLGRANGATIVPLYCK